MNVFRTFGRDLTASTVGDGTAKKGEMNFAFIDMGQGDCILISDPENNVYVVDCGNIGGPVPPGSMDKAQKLLRTWAGDKKIELILTHPDQDHYNKFHELLTGVNPAVMVKNIYFSLANSDTSPLGNYTQNSFSSKLHDFGNPDLAEITLNSTTTQYKMWTESTNYKVCETHELIVDSYELARGTNKKDWSINIIAGNVESDYFTESDISNTASLVTLVQFDTLKLLLTGDSTVETFAYLYKFHKTDIANVDTFQIPHHGSETSLPDSSFVNTVNPKSLIISVGLLNTASFLPKKTVIDAWLKSKALRPGQFVIDYWVSGNDYYDSNKRLHEIIDVVWKTFSFNATTSRTFFWLSDPKDANKSTGFYGFSFSNYFLYRAQTDKELWLTGVEGSLFDQNWG